MPMYPCVKNRFNVNALEVTSVPLKRLFFKLLGRNASSKLLAIICLLQVTRAMCEIWAKLSLKVTQGRYTDVVEVFLLLTLNSFYVFLWNFNC